MITVKKINFSLVAVTLMFSGCSLFQAPDYTMADPAEIQDIHQCDQIQNEILLTKNQLKVMSAKKHLLRAKQPMHLIDGSSAANNQDFFDFDHRLQLDDSYDSYQQRLETLRKLESQYCE